MKASLLFVGWITLTVVACSPSTNESVAPRAEDAPIQAATTQPFLLTQALLDSVTTRVSPADSAITGDGFGVRNDGSDRNLKDIYTNKPLGRALRIGDIIVVRSFQNNNGGRGRLDFVDIMVRREAGFNEAGANFEYFRMDFDATTDYNLHPNGLVPTLDNTRDRGLDIARAGCVTCHRLAPGNDFLFTTR